MTVKVIGHRGARGLLPEQSLAGIAKALELGVDGVEVDIGVTADRQVVAYHDYALNCDITRDSTGQWLDRTGEKICQLTLDELRSHDIGRIRPGSEYEKQFPHQQPVDGCRIPTLEEIVQLVREHSPDTTICIEVKRSPVLPTSTLELEVYVDTIVTEIQQLEIASCSIIHSFDWSVLHRINKLAPHLKLWYLTAQMQGFNTVSGSHEGAWTNRSLLSDHDNSIPRMIQAVGGGAWSSNHDILTAELVDEAHELGLKVYAWTANDFESFQLLCDAGLDGITTDYPDRLLSFLGRIK